jgi:hypothetical protein
VAGNISDVSTGDGITIDLTAPAGTTVSDGTGDDITYTGSDSSLSAVWPAFTETVSGIAKYEYAIGSTSGGTDIVDWTDNSTDTSFTKTSLSLSSGTVYYISVKATDNAENESTTITSDGVTVDTAAPLAGSVVDGTDTDIDWDNSTATLIATWSDFEDALSGIEKYEYAIGTTSGGTDVVDWTDNSTDTTVTRTDLTLTNGTTYYISVRSTDNVGNVSSVASSDGITIDTDAPTIASVIEGSLTTDVDYQNSDTTLIIVWTGSDTASGIAHYDYALGTASADSNTVTWTSSGTDTAVILTNLTLDEDTTYYLSARATDVAGNLSALASGDGITIDLTAPAGTTVNDGTGDDISYTGSDTTLSANWPAFTEDVSGISHYEIGVDDGDGDYISWTSIGDTTTHTFTGLNLTNGTLYYVKVLAMDVAGNLSDVVSGDGVTVDIEGPFAGTVFDGDSLDVDWTNSDSILAANWKDFSDPLSGIQYYEYAIGTEIDSVALVDWTSAGSDTFFTETDLTLISSETYYVRVKATDNVNNEGNVAVSDGIMVDLIIPLVGELYDGIDGEDQDWQSSDSTFSLYWSGSDSRELNYYQYSVGTSLGDSNTVSWTSVSTNTSVTLENVELLEEQTYYGNVRAVDRAGNVSDVVSSDGISIDYTPPAIEQFMMVIRRYSLYRHSRFVDGSLLRI